ncbi:MAG: hypothetical protein R3B74_10285 [Nitrospirales bacterium]|nr:hypothetical protein [Nitrospirales bacterium]
MWPNPSLTIILLSVLALVGWTCFVAAKNRPRIWDWLDTAVATVLSVTLALGTGFWVYDRQRTEEQTNERIELEFLLTAELSDIQRVLQMGERMTLNFPDGSKQAMLITTVQPLVIENAASSGLFSARDTENLLHLARKIRMFHIHTQAALTLIAARPGKEELTFAAENIEKSRIGILESIDLIAKHLSLSLTQHVE